MHSNPQPLLWACDAYADRRGWRVVDSLHDATGQSDPTKARERPALARAIEKLTTTDASVLLTVSPEMISTLATEYAQITDRVSHAGGFIHTMGWPEIQPDNRRSA
ncbi:hypothetical protein [Streptomyces sp. MBT62]|uniref:hypothetical protein n=1 Tax=Streptomyces sp. MBT62 TaxID=2800410 RepID=UPI00190E4DC6|nr:hypothetical protein [Streptomyces sp. MBT62]MBK3571221.1 hypothetical protein [Streptomyces sp. MBT62]